MESQLSASASWRRIMTLQYNDNARGSFFGKIQRIAIVAPAWITRSGPTVLVFIVRGLQPHPSGGHGNKDLKWSWTGQQSASDEIGALSCVTPVIAVKHVNADLAGFVV